MHSLIEKVEGLEKAEIAAALERAGWVKAKAARMLGITERMIGYKIKKYGINKEVMAQEEEPAAQGENESKKIELQNGISKEER